VNASIFRDAVSLITIRTGYCAAQICCDANDALKLQRANTNFLYEDHAAMAMGRASGPLWRRIDLGDPSQSALGIRPLS
jgi:hypothetical protein